jgi:hypothetical protein
LKASSIAITSPTDFIWVVSLESACGNFSNAEARYFRHYVINAWLKGCRCQRHLLISFLNSSNVKPTASFAAIFAIGGKPVAFDAKA